MSDIDRVECVSGLGTSWTNEQKKKVSDCTRQSAPQICRPVDVHLPVCLPLARYPAVFWREQRVGRLFIVAAWQLIDCAGRHHAGCAAAKTRLVRRFDRMMLADLWYCSFTCCHTKKSEYSSILWRMGVWRVGSVSHYSDPLGDFLYLWNTSQHLFVYSPHNTHTHTYTHISPHLTTHTHTHTHIHTFPLTSPHTHTHTHTHIHTFPLTSPHTHTHTYTHISPHLTTNTHTHTYTYSYSKFL